MSSPRRSPSVLMPPEKKEKAEAKNSKTQQLAIQRFVTTIICFLDDTKKHPEEFYFFGLLTAAHVKRKNQLKKELHTFLFRLDTIQLRVIIHSLQTYEAYLSSIESNHYLNNYRTFLKELFEKEKMIYNAKEMKAGHRYSIDEEKLKSFLKKDIKRRKLYLNKHISNFLGVLDQYEKMGEGALEIDRYRTAVMASDEHADKHADEHANALSLAFLLIDGSPGMIHYSNTDLRYILDYREYAYNLAFFYVALQRAGIFNTQNHQLVMENMQDLALMREAIGNNNLYFTHHRSTHALKKLIALAQSDTKKIEEQSPEKLTLKEAMAMTACDTFLSPAIKEKCFLLLSENPKNAGQLRCGIRFFSANRMLDEEKKADYYLNLLLQHPLNAHDFADLIFSLEKKTDLLKKETNRKTNLALLKHNRPFIKGLYHPIQWLIVANLLRGEEGQKNFMILMRYASAHHAIDKAMYNTIPTQEGFDMIMEEIPAQHNAQYTSVLVAWMRANNAHPLRQSGLQLVNEMLKGTGIHDIESIRKDRRLLR